MVNKYLFSAVMVIIAVLLYAYAILNSNSVFLSAALIPLVVALVGPIITETFELRQRLEEFKERSYAEIDRMYFDLLQFTFANPEMYDEEFTNSCSKSGDRKLKYDIYALSYWNMCETVYDNVILSELNDSLYGGGNSQIKAMPHGQSCPQTSRTWIPVMLEAKHLHGRWFSANRDQFKADFVEYINRLDNVTLDESVMDKEGVAEVILRYANKNYDKPRILAYLERRWKGASVMEVKLRVCEDFLLGILIRFENGNPILVIDPAYTHCGYEDKVKEAGYTSARVVRF